MSKGMCSAIQYLQDHPKGGARPPQPPSSSTLHLSQMHALLGCCLPGQQSLNSIPAASNHPAPNEAQDANPAVLQPAAEQAASDPDISVLAWSHSAAAATSIYSNTMSIGQRPQGQGGISEAQAAARASPARSQSPTHNYMQATQQGRRGKAASARPSNFTDTQPNAQLRQLFAKSNMQFGLFAGSPAVRTAMGSQQTRSRPHTSASAEFGLFAGRPAVRAAMGSQQTRSRPHTSACVERGGRSRITAGGGAIMQHGSERENPDFSRCSSARKAEPRTSPGTLVPIQIPTCTTILGAGPPAVGVGARSQLGGSDDGDTDAESVPAAAEWTAAQKLEASRRRLMAEASGSSAAAGLVDDHQ